MADDLTALISDLKEPEALESVERALKDGKDPLEILGKARTGLEIVGRRFVDNEYFVPHLVFSGEILRRIVELLEPHMKKEQDIERLGKVIIGTVVGDIHDIGKNIVTFMLDVNGFEVFDLGVDVPPQKFVDKIKETGARVVGLSGFLTLAFDSMKETIAAIVEAGLRSDVKIMIGGGQVDAEIMSYTSADAFGNDAMEAVKIARDWTRG